MPFERKIKLSNEDESEQHESSVEVVTRVNPQVKEPSLYKVILLNDDFTPMDFVIDILKKYFNKDHTAATEIMLNIHNRGQGLCGVYTYDVAETKVALVTNEAQSKEYPLQCRMEKS